MSEHLFKFRIEGFNELKKGKFLFLYIEDAVSLPI
jgi:hypothetical protein